MGASRHHDVEMGHPGSGFGQKTVELSLGGCRRVGVVKHITWDQKDVNVLAYQGVKQPRKKLRVLKAAFELVQGLAEVPVGGMEDAHISFFPKEYF